MKTISLLMLSFVSPVVFAQNEDSVFIRKVSDYILDSGRSYDDLRYLTKQIGARLSGSAGMYKAEKWGLKTMQEAGADKVWLQECKVPHWVRGGKDEAIAIGALNSKKKRQGTGCGRAGQFKRNRTCRDHGAGD